MEIQNYEVCPLWHSIAGFLSKYHGAARWICWRCHQPVSCGLVQNSCSCQAISTHGWLINLFIVYTKDRHNQTQKKSSYVQVWHCKLYHNQKRWLADLAMNVPSHLHCLNKRLSTPFPQSNIAAAEWFTHVNNGFIEVNFCERPRRDILSYTLLPQLDTDKFLGCSWS